MLFNEYIIAPYMPELEKIEWWTAYPIGMLPIIMTSG